MNSNTIFCCSVSRLCPTLCDPMECSPPCFPSLSPSYPSLSYILRYLMPFAISQSLLRLMSIELMMPPNHLMLCCPLLLPAVFPSIRVFSNESALRSRWPKYWSFSISTSNEYSGLYPLGLTGVISLLSKGLSSFLQHHSSEGISSFLLSGSHIRTWLLEKPQLWLYRPYGQSDVSTF